MRPNAGFCDKVRPVTSREVVPKRYAFSSRILSISFRMRLSHKTPEANRAGIRVGVRDETRGVRKCHAASASARRPTARLGSNSRKPPITEKLRLRRSFSRERAGESSAVSRRPVFRDRTRSRRFFHRSARVSRVARRDATASIATRRREEKRHATIQLLASELRVFTHDTRLPCHHLV